MEFVRDFAFMLYVDRIMEKKIIMEKKRIMEKHLQRITLFFFFFHPKKSVGKNPFFFSIIPSAAVYMSNTI